MKKNKTHCKSQIARREFIGAAASATALTIVPRYVLGGPGNAAPSEKLNIAGVGAGGRGYPDLVAVAGENIVALCDVDDKRAAKTYARFPKARRYRDYRVMFDREEKNMDAVIVASTDHTHIPASVTAMKRGKHVYCEKPLGRDIHEVRYATKIARRYGVATQMGNGAHSGHNYRAMVAMVRAGTIGEVREVHCWCDQAWAPGDRPKARPPVPKHLHWDLWLGPAPVRPYHPCYHPQGWRQWWDFGNGRLGDMGCHMIDLPFSALDLKYPLTAEAQAPYIHHESAPPWLIVKWTFAARGKLPPVELTWYDGGKRPPLQKKLGMPDYPEATLFVGSKGMLIADYGRFKLYPEEKFAGVQRPRIPAHPQHPQDWLAGCKTGSRCGCDFRYSGPLTETVLLGTVAHRAGRKIEWDAENMAVTNCPEANEFIRREYRQGWTV